MICMFIPRAPATHIFFNATGQQYHQTVYFTYLGGAVTETLNLSTEIDRRIRARWMGFRLYTRELCDHPQASLLHLKAQLVKSEVLYSRGYFTRMSVMGPFQGPLQ